MLYSGICCPESSLPYLAVRVSHPLYDMNGKYSISAITRKQRNAGFTLIEVMVTVAIVAILAAVSMPIYSNYLIKGNRAAAQAYLVDLAIQQQQYLSDTRTYASSLTQLNTSVPSPVSKYYTISITNGTTPPSFVVTATPIAGSRQASDAALSIDNAGVKTPTDSW